MPHVVSMTDAAKICRRCLETRQLEEFYKNQTYCKYCSLELCKKWKAENSDRYRSKQNEWRKANSELVKAWRRKDHAKNRERNAEQKHLRWKAQRLKVIQHLGGCCKRCGFADYRALQVDHVNGGGLKELRTEGGGGTRYLKKVIADTDGNYQLLCANCNWIKRYEQGEHVGRPRGGPTESSEP